MRTNADILPPIKIWRDKFPEKFAPYTHARKAIENLSALHSIPVENLISPEFVRRITWSPPAQSTVVRDEEAVRSALLTLGARAWQVDLVASAIADALLESQPLIIAEPVAEDGADVK